MSLTQDELITLIEKALGSITLKQGVREAKGKSPQSYAFHSVSAGVLALDICNAIYSSSDLGRKQLEKLAENYKVPSYKELCFFGGFLHDWNKLEDKENEAKEIIKKLGLSEDFLHGIAPMAEGHLPDNLHMPLWVSIKLADMLLVSDINSLEYVFSLKNSPAYKNAVTALSSYNLELDYVSSSFRLFTLVASKELFDKLFNRANGYFPLMSYPDGLVFLRRKDSSPILLSKVLDILSAEIFPSSSGAVDEKVEEIKKCLRSKEDLFLKMNTELDSVLYDDKGKVRQINAFLPSKICKPFEDVIGNLDNKAKLEVAKKVIDDLRDEIPYAILMYFISKFSKSDEDYIRRGLGIKEKSLAYLKSITDVQAIIDKILELLDKRYSESQGVDKTLSYYVKHSFGGDVMNDLPSIVEKPKDYCVVCGMPIYSDNPVRFSQYASELKGKAEIWIPREKGLEEIDSVRDSWKVCPICIYEANLMKDKLRPPYFVITFYPGVPVSLLNVIDFNFSKEVEYRVDENDTYLNVFKKLGGMLTSNPKKVIPAYFSSKVLIKANDVTSLSLSTRLTKTEVNKLLPFAPTLSIIFLTSPVSISTNVYEIPVMEGRIVSITSTFNYNFLKSLDSNLKTLYSAFAYSAKYVAMTKICGKSDLDNCLNYLVEEADLYSSVDPALGVLSIGMGVGTPIDSDDKFFSNFLPIAGFLLKVTGMVSQMGETLKSSIFLMANVLREVIKDKNVTKYDVTGFLRDGIDMFFRTTTVIKDKEDRVGIAVNASLSSLENKYTLNDEHRAKAFSALQNIFNTLYEIEEGADRSLALSVANTLTNWLYIAYKFVLQGDKS